MNELRITAHAANRMTGVSPDSVVALPDHEDDVCCLEECVCACAHCTVARDFEASPVEDI